MTVSADSWTAVYREILREERGRIGDWPTEESLLAFSLQELPPDEARIVRRFLLAYPQIALALAELDEPFAELSSVEDGALSDDEIEHDWDLLAARIERKEQPPPAPSRDPMRPVRPLWPTPAWWTASIAAVVLAFLLGGFLLHAPLAPPSAVRSQLLVPDGQRGPDQLPVPVAFEGREREILLRLGSLDKRAFDDYRIEIHEVRESGEIERFHQVGLERDEGGGFDLLLHRRSLAPGTYRIELYGRSGTAKGLVASYSITLQ